MTHTDTYVDVLNRGLARSDELLRSWMRWPWTRKKVPRLLREMAHEQVLLGIEHFMLGDRRTCASSFEKALDHRAEAQRLRSLGAVTYHDVQILSAALCVGLVERAEAFAAVVFDSFDPKAGAPRIPTSETDAMLCSRHGSVALLGWMARKPRPSIEIHANISEGVGPPFDQFRLWGRCALAGVSGDQVALQAALAGLAAFVRKQVAHGDFKYSEERHVYLPGMGIIALARRDGIVGVVVPESPQFPSALLAAMCASIESQGV